ncbi:MAG: acyltransferase [Lachnospiraceae bacterium]|nr:acyltransferase [Lachnospiraceae bacterium]
MDYKIIGQWLKNVDFTQLKKLISGREVAIWGAYAGGGELQRVLEKENIRVKCYIDAHKEQQFYHGFPVVKPHMMENDTIFVLVAVVGVRKEITDWLHRFQMQENVDYIYISKAIPQITVTKCGGAYKDIYGNTIEFDDAEINCSITMIGYNNRVKIGKGMEAKKSAHIVVENEASVVIGDYVKIYKEVQLEAINGGVLEIGKSSVIAKDSRITSRGAAIKLGNSVTVGERFLCLNGENAYVEIGNDSMISNDVSVIAYGGHSIFDLVQKINTARLNEEYVKIGNHVWIGKGVTVLHNADIGDGCIVGANSLVKLHTEKNCIIAGNPAKVIKENHTWDRRIDISFEDM